MTDEPQWLTESEMTAWRTLLQTTTGLLATLDQELQAEHGLPLAEYEVLAFCSQSPGAEIRMSELAAGLHLSPSGMTRRIDNMVKGGLVRREQCPNDRRAANVVLTDEGRDRIRAAAPTHVRGVREYFIDQLTEKQLAFITKALSSVKTDSDAARDACSER